jgi:hypothetical protein
MMLINVKNGVLGFAIDLDQSHRLITFQGDQDG